MKLFSTNAIIHNEVLYIWQTALGFLVKLLADVNLLIDKDGSLILMKNLLCCDNRNEAINWRERKKILTKFIETILQIYISIRW